MGVLSVLLKKKVLSVLLFKRVLSDGSRNPTCLFTFSKGGSKCLSVAIHICTWNVHATPRMEDEPRCLKMKWHHVCTKFRDTVDGKNPAPPGICKTL